MKIALAQLLPTPMDITANAKTGLKACDDAHQKGADLLLFPEMWSIGYAKDWSPLHAVPIWDSFITVFQEKAKELKMGIGLTFLEKKEEGVFNSFLLIDRKGCIILHYSKVHTCFFDKPESQLTPGTCFKVASFDGVQIGAMICFDREFPESARTLAKLGADIVLVPNACFMKNDYYGDLRFKQLQTRAFENVIGIAMANYPAPQEDGHSVIFMGNGAVLAQADETPQIIMADFDVDALRIYRANEIWGVQYLKTDAYL